MDTQHHYTTARCAVQMNMPLSVVTDEGVEFQGYVLRSEPELVLQRLSDLNEHDRVALEAIKSSRIMLKEECEQYFREQDAVDLASENC